VPLDDDNALVAAMQTVRSKYRLSNLLVTRGALGMCLVGQDAQPWFIPSIAREVYDVSGAGDTVIATLAVGVAAGQSYLEAARLANIAAGVVVGKLGTQPINALELKAAVGTTGENSSVRVNQKNHSLAAATVQVQAWKALDQKIVFTNGCFDLLHPGHIHLLNEAKRGGDRLIVGLNSDESVRRLKGAGRPILSETDRAAVLGALNCVDLIVIFEEDTPIRLIETLEPDVLVKGSDYRLETVVGREIVEAYGGKVYLVPVVEGYSTTRLAEKVSTKQGGRNLR
jgi:D-beta-D-heptose 7-phosphate kinase/D-beta-D-heptose 1-phosphate adenosyltransferase